MYSKFKFVAPLLLLVFLSSQKVNAQLSYDATITYVKKSLVELEELSRKYNDQYTYYLTNFQFAPYATDNNRVIMKYKRVFSDNTSDVFQITFNPKHIVSITKMTESTTNGFHFAQVTLTGPLALKIVTNNSDVETSEKTFTIPYVAGDPKAFLRLKAAIENLKTLSLRRDSYDPFAN